MGHDQRDDSDDNCRQNQNDFYLSDLICPLHNNKLTRKNRYYCISKVDARKQLREELKHKQRTKDKRLEQTPFTTKTNSLQHNASADQAENQSVAKNNPCDYDEEMQAENAVETPTSIAETPKAEPVKAVAERYTIVLASQTPMKHAEEFMARLSKKGFSQMTTMEMASSSKVRVVYGNYASETDAQNELRSLRQKDSSFREAWVLKIKQ